MYTVCDIIVSLVKAVLDVLWECTFLLLNLKPSRIRAGSTYLSCMVVVDCNSVPEGRIIYCHERVNMYNVCYIHKRE